MTQEAIGPAEGVELVGWQEERVLEFDFGAGEVAEIVEPLGVVGHDGVAETVGGPGELLSDARVHARVEAVVGGKEVRPEQLRQELVVGDVRDLGPDDGARLLIEMVTVPVRVLGIAAGRPGNCARARTVSATP